MHRQGFIRQELLTVIMLLVGLCVLVVLLTFRSSTSDAPYRPDGFRIVRDEHSLRPAEEAQPPAKGIDVPASEQKEVTTDSGLKYIDQRVGDGDKVKVGSIVMVTYTGKFTSGETFDTNVGRAPMSVTIGQKQVIKGWELGLLGMKAGGKRVLKIPHPLAYGEAGFPPKIPSKADLVFDIEVLKVVNR
ncbi:MAG: FKBP-type peptidyl-prolyl cis-trans isomerase [Gemmatales bacterium]